MIAAMTDNVVKFPGKTCLRLPPRDILEAAAEADLAQVLVIGVPRGRDGDPDFDGELFFSGSEADLAAINLLIDRAKKFVVECM